MASDALPFLGKLTRKRSREDVRPCVDLTLRADYAQDHLSPQEVEAVSPFLQELATELLTLSALERDSE